MPKELSLYSSIYNFVAEKLVTELEANKHENIDLRVNSPGGSVFAGWGIIAKMREHEKTIKIKVDGMAMSMAAFMLMFADEVEALDVAQIMIHRADMLIESDEDQKFLDRVNNDMKIKMSGKLNNDKLKELMGVTIDDIFDPEKRINVFLTAKEAKQIGLIDKIVKVTPKEIEALHNKYFQIAANAEEKSEKTEKIKKMNLETLKSEHSELYNQIIALGVQKEKDRVGAWMAFADIDLEAISKGIKDDSELTATAMAELNRKSLSKKSLENISAENPAAPQTGEASEQTEQEKNTKAFENEVRASLGLK